MARGSNWGRDFVGAKMSNLLFNFSQRRELPEEFRKQAEILCAEWDKVAVLVLGNPITAARLQEQFDADYRGD